MSKFKTDISRNGRKVFASITTGLNSTNVIHFTYDCTSEIEAELLVTHLRDRQNKRIKEIRKAEFFSGWKHAKAKKHGKGYFSWFCGNLSPDATNEF